MKLVGSRSADCRFRGSRREPSRQRGWIIVTARLTPAKFAIALALGATALSAAYSAAHAAPCGSGFDLWLADFRTEATAAGISQKTIATALDGLTEDPATLQRDRAQHVFTQTFEQFSGRMISADRMKKGSAHLVKNATMFERIEREYGVPGPIIVAIWGLETDFGVNQGKFQIIRSVATLAHDCRRTDKFRTELLATLRIIESGDMTPAELKGLWAGEIGQTQFLPSSYIDYAVDFDGNGKRDLIHSAPDALASTANYLKNKGWQRGEPWDEGTANFNVILEWNRAKVYARTIALFAQRLDAATTTASVPTR
jgi:lytic murein transglycosylase